MPPAADGNTQPIALASAGAGSAKLRLACRIAQRWPSSQAAEANDALHQAISDLLPVLICGEASAEQTFAHAVRTLATRLPAPMAEALRSVEADERRHGQILGELCSTLPPPRSQQPARAAAHFVRQLQEPDPALHLANIAALDAALCRVLSAACLPGRPLTHYPDYLAIFDRIRRDEARHVRISRRTALYLGVGSDVLARARIEVGAAFAALLLPQAEAFAVLGIDEAELRQRLKVGLKPELAIDTDFDTGREPAAS